MDFDLNTISSSVDSFFEESPSLRVANAGKVRISSVVQLSGFSFISSDTLVRVSQKDFWKIGEDAEGHFIERLVSDDTGPILEG